MRITDFQISTLNSLRCIRINEEDSILREVENFSNPQNIQLENTIKGSAFQEDSDGGIAYYVVLSPENDIFAYFSLKCGLLFDKHGDLEIIDSKKKLIQLINKRKLLSERSELADEIKKELDKQIESIKDNLKSWIEIDENDSKHKRVAKTYSGIEICHFCVNENARDKWDALGLPEKNRQGVTIFWNKIVPIVLKIKESVGLEYIYLFAADSSSDEILINYYVDRMNFKRYEDVFAALPVYDFGCTLLCQPVDSLIEASKDFYNDFNPDSDTI